MSRRSRILLMIGLVELLWLVAPERRPVPADYRFISAAEAVVGRPLTPVSVAGVARRTARRCAVGVYKC